MKTTDTKTKILFILVLVAALIGGFFSYQRTVVDRDFEIFYSEEEGVIENL